MYLLAPEVHVQFVYRFNTRLYCFNELHHYNAILGTVDECYARVQPPR
jgi:hypothetical protein